MNKLIVQIVGVMAATVIGKGLLLWLGTQFQIYPEQWVASFLGLAKDGITSYPSISWAIAGLTGLIGLFVGPYVYKLGLEKLGTKNKGNIISKPFLRLNEWNADENVIDSFRSLANEFTNIEVIYFDSINFPFSERLASAFELAGWEVNFNKTAQGNHNPHYYEGVEIKGDNRILVESIANTLESTGCAGVKSTIGATEIKQGHPKYSRAQNKIYVTIGYEN